MICAIELKKRVAGASIFSIIISKLCHKKKSCLIILFKVEKSPKVCLYYAILSFGLVICLRIKSN